MGEYAAHSKRMKSIICDTMISLLEEKPFTKITVQDILQRANIQRATFYRYFRDKYEVAEAINEILAQELLDHSFEGLYEGKHFSDYHQTMFNLKYQKVMEQMLHLRVENVDLSHTISRIFCERYQALFPDADRYELFLACHHFLASAFWFTDNSFTVPEIRKTVFSDAPARWLARYYQVDPEHMIEFVHQHQKNSSSG